MRRIINRKKPVVALITNHDDDVYCFRKELIEAMKKEGYNVLVSCPYGKKIKLMRDIKFEHDDVYIDRRGMNPLSDFKLLIHYRKLMYQYHPDIVLTYTSKPNVYASLVAASLKIPYINNITGLGSVLSMGKVMQALVLTMFRVAFRKSRCVFFQNKDNMKLALKKGLVKGNYKLIPGSGVNLERYPLEEYPEGGDGITGEKVIFNYIGRVLHDKGVDDYIEAAKIIKRDYPNTEFNILGFIEPTENHYKKELEKLSSQGIIHYWGQQEDVKPFIARSHAIIHPSTYGEGMSNVLLENASSGRFIITTDNPGCKETVENGVTGYIYQGGKVDQLVEKIRDFLKLCNKDRRLAGRRGRERMKNTFNRDRVVKAYLQEIHNSLEVTE